MVSKSSDHDSPCFFFKLPPELRLMIYEQYTGPRVPGQDFISVSKYSQVTNKRLAKVITLIHVNTQVRQESLPTVYRNFTLRVWTDWPWDRKRSRLWAEKMATPAVLASLVKFEFKLLPDCTASVKIDLARLEGLMTQVKLGECTECTQRVRCDHLNSVGDETEAKLQGLKLVKNQRCIMTLELMQSLVERFCNMSEEYEKARAESPDASPSS